MKTTAISKITRKSKSSLNPIFLTPRRPDGISVPNLLQNHFGDLDGGVKIFKPSIINAVKSTDYNGVKFQLEQGKEVVKLVGLTKSEKLVIGGWKIDDILSGLQSKNRVSRLSKIRLKNMISTGKLGVKFNISKIKDHGTQWKIVS